MDFARLIKAAKDFPLFRRYAAQGIETAAEYQALKVFLRDYGLGVADEINRSLMAMNGMADAEKAFAFKNVILLLGGTANAGALGKTQDLVKALPLGNGARGRAIGDLMTIVANSKITYTSLATFVGGAPPGLFTKWPLETFLKDSARMSSVLPQLKLEFCVDRVILRAEGVNRV